MDALNVNPSLGEVGLESTRFVIAPFLQQESQVKCHPEAGGDPGRLIGKDS